MSSLEDILRSVQSAANRALWFLDDPVVRTVVTMFIGLYAAVYAPRVSPAVKRLFDATWFKVLFFAVVAFLSQKDPTVALVVALAFVLTMQGLRKYDVAERVQRVVGMAVEDVETPAEQPDPSSAFDAQVPVVLDASVPRDRDVYRASETDTQVGRPAFADLPHAFAQGLGEPLQGYEPADSAVWSS